MINNFKWTPTVCVTHEPTGISATCTECRTTREGKDKAMKLLRSRLWAAQNLPPRPDVVAAYDLPDDQPFPHELGEFASRISDERHSQ